MNLKKFNITTISVRLLAAVCLVVITTGCIEEDSLCPPDRGPLVKKGMTLNFTLLTREVNNTRETRSLVAPPNPQDGTAAENFLDISDITFIIFKEDGSLLTTFLPDVAPEDVTYTTYDVKYKVLETLFDYVTGDYINIYIMAIGNTGNISVLPNLTTMFERSSSFDFPLRWSTTQTEGTLWTPDIDAKRGIPMSGMQYFSIPRTALENSSYENPLNLSKDMGADNKDINMLRCMAKIEVVDLIGETDSNIVEQVSMSGYNNLGRILPEFDQWKIQTPWETQYVTQPSIPSSAEFLQGPPILFFEDIAASERRTDKRPVFSAYLPEFNHMVNGVTTPEVSVVLNIGNTTETRTFGLTAYDNGATTNETTDLLRNNIYRYEVSMNLNKELVITVCPRAEFTTYVPPFE